MPITPAPRLYGDIDAVADAGADPTWAADSTASIQNALNSCSPGMTVGLPPGLYKTSAPLIVPPYVGMAGVKGTPQVSSWSEYGSVIKPSATWAQGSAPVAAAILMLDPVTGGYSGTSEEQHFENLLISGSALPTATQVHGIASYRQVHRVQMHRVHVGRMPGDGIHQDYDDTHQPDAWTASHVFCRYNLGRGYQLRSADSSWTKCLATNSGGEGWWLDTVVNSQFTGCRSEWSGGHGYRYQCRNDGVGSGSTLFSGCSTDRSSKHGFLATNFGGTGAVPLLLSGCYFRRDGAAGGSQYAALCSSGYAATICATGSCSFPGYDDDGGGLLTPYLAIKATGTGARIQLAGGYWQGSDHSWQVDPGNSVLYNAGSVTFAKGATASPQTIVTGP